MIPLDKLSCLARMVKRYDVIPFDAATLEEIANADLKANGINANALYWYDRIDSNCIHVFNAYGNDFEYYNDMDELLDYYFNVYTRPKEVII